MTNDQCGADQREDAASDDHQARRVLAFQLSCAVMRERTQQELERLAAKRAAVRMQLGVSSERMARWRDEHQQMLLSNSLATSTRPEQ